MVAYRTIFPLLLALVLAGCSQADIELPETPQVRQERLSNEMERNLQLDPVLPRAVVTETSYDVFVLADKPVASVLGRIGGGQNGWTPTCAYVQDGVVLLRTKDNRLFRISKVERRHYGKRSWDYEAYYIERQWGDDKPLKLLPEEQDYSRWVNFSEALCPEDGQRYADAWMKYRFPEVKL